MTLLPVEDTRITVPAQDWPEPEPVVRCQGPVCQRQGTQWHHVVRRSATGGPVDWVCIDGLVLWNKVRVCLWCHQRINDHLYWIRYEDGVGWVWWKREARHPASLGMWVQHPKSEAWFARLEEIVTWRADDDD